MLNYICSFNFCSERQCGTDSAKVRSQRNVETMAGIGAENSGLRELNIESEQNSRIPLKYIERGKTEQLLLPTLHATLV